MGPDERYNGFMDEDDDDFDDSVPDVDTTPRCDNYADAEQEARELGDKVTALERELEEHKIRLGIREAAIRRLHEDAQRRA